MRREWRLQCTFTLNSSKQFWTCGTSKSRASAGKKLHLSIPMEIGTKNQNFLNLTSAAQFRLIDLFLAITVYFLIRHLHCTRVRFTVLVQCWDCRSLMSAPLHAKQWCQAILQKQASSLYLKNKTKIGNLTEKQAQHALAGKFNKTKISKKIK